MAQNSLLADKISLRAEKNSRPGGKIFPAYCTRFSHKHRKSNGLREIDEKNSLFSGNLPLASRRD
jgi:hypothetical protein